MAETYSDILSGLGKTPSLLREILDDAKKEKWLIKTNDKWSIQENVGHLLCIESLWIARLDDFVMKNEFLRPWNGTNADTDAARFNEQNMNSILRDFSSIREAHVNMLSGFGPQATSMVSVFRESGQKLDLSGHVEMMLRHDLHHIQTIHRILTS